MEKDYTLKEIEHCKILLKNPLLKYNERHSLEVYLESMENKNAN